MPGIIHYGWAESTAAMRNILGGGATRASGKRRGKKRAKKSAKPRKRAKAAKRKSGKKAHLVKGSAAAKKYMAKLRKKAMKARG